MTISDGKIVVPRTNDSLETLIITRDNGDVVHREAVYQPVSASCNNTTTDLLLASETFTGTAEEAWGDGVTVSCQSDVSGTLFFDFSVDGTNFGTFPTAGFVVAAGVHEFHTAKVNGRFFRVRFVNDASDQAEFRLYTYFGPHTQPNAPLNQSIGIDSDAIITRAVAVGQDEAGVYTNAGVVTSGGKTSSYVAMGFTNTFTVHLDVSSSAADVAYMLVDLSDTTNWKHTNTTEVVIEYIVIEVDPGASFVGEVKLGFLTNVDATNGDFNQIFDIDLRRKADLFVEVINFGSHGFHCKADSHFGPISANSTLFQTDVDLGGPDDPTTGAYPSGAGDLVMLLATTAADAVNISLTIGYETVE